MNSYALTIFTPTFNRAHTLPALYESLCIQKCKDFEWIVVDDGSYDNTKDLIRGWIAEGIINIRYFYQQNAGKMAAHNFAVDQAVSELFVCLDSDDVLTKNSVEECCRFWREAAQLRSEAEGEICGVIAYKDIFSSVSQLDNPARHIIEKAKAEFPEGIVHIEEMKRSGFYAEWAFAIKTDILRKYKYPVFEGEKFVTDAYLWEKLDHTYRFLLAPHISQICRYNPDGYTFNYRRLLFSNPQGYRAYHNQRVEFRLRGWLRSVICYDSISIRMGFKGFISNSASPFTSILFLPAGFLKYLSDSYHLKTFGRLC